MFDRRKRASRSIFRATNIPAFLALFVIVVAWAIVERQNRQTFEKGQRAAAMYQLSVIRSRLEGNINGNLHLASGLVAAIATEPDMGQQRFSAVAAKLLQSNSQIRHFAAAQDFKVKMVHPLQGNEFLIGLNYRDHPEQQRDVENARNSGESVLAGPIDLVQGGRAFIARLPVFIDEADGSRRLWGSVSPVIDIDQLYQQSGMYDDDLPINIALVRIHNSQTQTTQFYGPATILTSNPVTIPITLSSNTWQISAIPKGGWATRPTNIMTLRLLLLAAAALVMIPALIAGRLLEERQRNIRTLRRREAQLGKLSRRLRLALDTSKVAVWEMNIGDTLQFWDARMNELYGYPLDGGPRDASNWKQRVHPDDREHAETDFNEVLTAGSYFSQFRIVLDDGEIRHIRAMGARHKEGDAPPRIVGVAWDVTADVSLAEELKRVNTLTEARNIELEAARARIEHNALHDSLTGLPNRRYLDEYLADHATRFTREGERAGLLQIDLDRFKQVNDTLGHQAGDAMLVHAARILRAAVAENDFVARVGGDEFVVVRRWPLAKATSYIDELTTLSQGIIDDMQEPMIYKGHKCWVGTSIGIASDMDYLADPKRLLVDADIALYRAKDRGRNRYQFFNDALQAEIMTTKRVADDILSGLEQNQFVAHYQPQFCADTLKVVGVEALARWQQPNGELLLPAAFMKTAEELNVVANLDQMILDQALADFHDWEALGLAIPKVSVNVSARRLRDEELITGLRQMNIRPGVLSFELIESIFLDDHDDLTAWNVEEIKELGIDIEIDDFGTGYASIVSLLKLKPRRLKIDRQLVMPIVHSAGQRQLVGSIIDIGHSLGIEVLAEGVETIEHAQVLKSLGCDALQGYAFAKPMSNTDLVKFIEERRLEQVS